MAAPLIVAGRGNVGRSLARAFKAAGLPCHLVAARDGAPRLVRGLSGRAHALVLLAVPDGAVAQVATAIAEADARLEPSVSFAHISGALGLDALDALRGRHAVGSFHPLRAIPRPLPPDALKGIVVAVDGSTEGLRTKLSSLARKIGARPRMVAGSDRVLYHAAAVFASNYAVALLEQAAELLEQIGWTQREAVSGLLPLMTGAVDATKDRPLASVLTGPIRRGDVSTVSRHLEALARLPGSSSDRPSALDLYRMLGAITLQIAREAGLDAAAAERVRRALTPDVAATRRRLRR